MRLKSKRMSKHSKAHDSFKIWTVRILIVAAIIWFIWAQEHVIISNSFVYYSQEIPKGLVGYNIVHISDIKNTNINVYNSVKKLEPDIIVLTGGYADDKGNYNNTVRTVNKLCELAPVYYINNPIDPKGILDGTGAISLVDTNFEINVESVDANTFIRETYGNTIINRAEKGDEQALNYINYVNQMLQSEDLKINVFGLDTYNVENGQYQARDKAYELILNSDATVNVALLGNIDYLDEICKADIDILMFGGTYGVNQISNTYTKGMYANNGTQIFVSSGVGTPQDMTRILNFPSIQCITLSDGTIQRNNPLENLLSKIFKDVGTIYDNDGGFQAYTQEY